MPPTDSPNTGSLAGTSPGQGTRSPTSGTGTTLPAREADTPRSNMSGGPFPTGSAVGTERDEDRSRGVGEQAREMKDRARDQARQTYDEVKQFTNEALDKARRQWSDSRGRLSENAQNMIGQQKQRLCDGITGAAEAARAAAERLEEREDRSIAGYARTAADGLEQVRDYLAAADVNDMLDDVRGFTRRHPEWVLGGLFVAGLAMSRFLKADRRFGPRGRPPTGADESLYGDIYRSQFDADDDFGSGDYQRSHGTGYQGAYREPGSSGSYAGYNPSGSLGGAYGQSYGSTSAGSTGTTGSSSLGGTGTTSAGKGSSTPIGTSGDTGTTGSGTGGLGGTMASNLEGSRKQERQDQKGGSQ